MELNIFTYQCTPPTDLLYTWFSLTADSVTALHCHQKWHSADVTTSGRRNTFHALELIRVCTENGCGLYHILRSKTFLEHSYTVWAVRLHCTYRSPVPSTHAVTAAATTVCSHQVPRKTEGQLKNRDVNCMQQTMSQCTTQPAAKTAGPVILCCLLCTATWYSFPPSLPPHYLPIYG